jgi:hypothetical protein
MNISCLVGNLTEDNHMATYTPITVDVPEGVNFHSDGTADVFKRSMLSGKMYIGKFNLTREQFEAWKVSGKMIQDAMPHLTKDEREFFLSGSTPGEWDAAFKEDE